MKSQPPAVYISKKGILMFRLLTAVLLFASFNAVAQTQVPNVFEDGTPASAAEVNANFDALEAAIDAIPEGPAGAQGPAGADGVAAGLSCSTDQIIRYDGNNWVCAHRYWGELYTFRWDQNNYYANGLPGNAGEPQVISLFSVTTQVVTRGNDEYDANEQYECGNSCSTCNVNCRFRLAGVGQHGQCQATVSENSGSPTVFCRDYPQNYCYFDGRELVRDEPVRITVFCSD